jgi:hypothetical protein
MSGNIVVPCLLALLIGIVAGMRAMTAPAAISWAARLGKLGLVPDLSPEKSRRDGHAKLLI